MDNFLENVFLHEYFDASDATSDSDTTDDDDDELVQIVSQFITVDRTSVKNYFEHTVRNYLDDEFIRHFRIHRELFFELCNQYEQSEVYQKMLKYNRNTVIELGKSLAVFLWFSGHEACSYMDLSDRFNVSTSTIHLLLMRMITFISNLSPDVIRWPTLQEMEQEALKRENKSRMPGIIGCLDGSHIRVDPPRGCNKDEFINRKGDITIHLQAVCNSQRQFIDIFMGFPGSVHDSRVLTNSPLIDKLQQLPIGFRLLADSGYPCLKQILVPYRDNGHLNNAQKRFNTTLSNERIDTEHAFGILKQRFRQLYYCKLRGIKVLCHFIRACTVLHNLSRTEEIRIFNNEENPEVNAVDIPVVFNDGNIVEDGALLRDAICYQLFN